MGAWAGVSAPRLSACSERAYSQENASVAVSAAAMTPSTWGASAAEFAITLLFEAEQPPWIIAQHLE
jgi:hypothetical protein